MDDSISSPVGINTAGGSIPITTREWAEYYRTRGFGLVVLKDATNEKGDKFKTPALCGWTKKSASPDQFPATTTAPIGIATGWLSDGNKPGHALVVVDNDSPEAVALADQYLPHTAMIVGRRSKPGCHRYYLVPVATIPPECVPTTKKDYQLAAEALGLHPGPRVIRFGGVLDFQASGQQVVAPPSIHKSGEPYEWVGGLPGEPAVLDYVELLAAVCKLAEACGVAAETFARRNLPVDALAAHGFVVPVAPPKPPRTPAESRTSSTRPPASPGDGSGDSTPTDKTPHMGGAVTRYGRDYAFYLRQAGLPRSGEGGNDKTFRLLAFGLIDLDLERGEVLSVFCSEVNTLLIALEDEWEVCALNRILDSIASRPPDPNHPKGGKRRDRNTTGEVQEKWDSPLKIARRFYLIFIYLFIKNTAFRFTGKAYESCSFDYLRADLSRFCATLAEENYHERVRKWTASGAAGELEADRKALAEERAKPASEETAAAVARLERRIEQAEKKKPSAAKAFTRHEISDVLEALRGLCQLPDGTPFDSWLKPNTQLPNGLLSVGNGILDTSADPPALYPHSADFFTLIHVPVEYRPDAPAPVRWRAFAHDVFQGDEQRVAILQELFGACLAPRLPLKMFACLAGSGNNGKSVALAVLRLMLGERNTCAVSLDQLASNRFASFALFGKLANVVGDQGFVTLKDEGTLKTMTGGDLVAFEQKGKDTLFAVNTAKIIAAMNAVPHFNDASEAIWNRALILPFTWTVPADRINPALLTADYWRDELPGILLWALAGLRRLKANNGRFTGSAVCDEAKDKHRIESNPVREFLKDHYESGEDGDFISVADVYTRYHAYASDRGERHIASAKTIGRELGVLFPASTEDRRWDAAKKFRHRGRVGVREKAPPPEEKKPDNVEKVFDTDAATRNVMSEVAGIRVAMLSCDRLPISAHEGKN